MQKAREGKWNGGFTPYGYSLIDGKLEVNEEEAVAIRMVKIRYLMLLLSEGLYRIRFIVAKFLMEEDGQKRFMVQEMSIGRLRKTITC